MNTTTTISTTNNSLIMSSVPQKTPTKRTKTRKNKNNSKPIKVVYISNPMRVKTSASEFRALVQELTGQDAESPPDPSRFQYPGGDDGGGGGGGGNHHVGGAKIVCDENEHTLVVVPPPEVCDPNNKNNNNQGQQPSGGSSSFESSEPYDDVFTAEMISAFLPTSVFHESSQVDDWRV